MLRQLIILFACLVASSARAEIVYNRPGERPPPKFGCAPGTEIYGNPEKRGGRVMCVAAVKKDRYVKHGMYMSYDQNKELRRKGFYYDDKKHGRWTEFDRHGAKKQQEDYEFGKLVKRSVFDEDGKESIKFDSKVPKIKRGEKNKPQTRVIYGTNGRPL